MSKTRKEEKFYAIQGGWQKKSTGCWVEEKLSESLDLVAEKKYAYWYNPRHWGPSTSLIRMTQLLGFKMGILFFPVKQWILFVDFTLAGLQHFSFFQ